MATLAHAQVCELFTRFGEKGVSSEQVAQSLAADVRAYAASTAALGPHLADQWALPLALPRAPDPQDHARDGGAQAAAVRRSVRALHTRAAQPARILRRRFSSLVGDSRISSRGTSWHDVFANMPIRDAFFR